jgi:ribosomal protein L40E
MRTFIAFAALPVFCILGIAITLIVIVYLVFRNLNLRNSLNSDFDARIGAETKNSQTDAKPFISSNLDSKPCPACGADNPITAVKCDYCGAKLI